MELRFSIMSSNIGGGADELSLKCEAPKPPKMETCIICDGGFDLNNLHPSHLKYFGEHPKLCRQCGFNFGAYGRIWSPDLESRIIAAKESGGRSRRCFMCGKGYNMLGSFYRRRYFIDEHFPKNMEPIDEDPQWGLWAMSYGLDFLYPNLYTSICPRCFQELFARNITPSYESDYAAMKELGDKIGKLPERNFTNYLYAFNTQSDVEWFLNLLKRLPNPELINVRHGSYFKLLLKSGLLPEGTRRMRLGTMVLAKDGDMCFSLAEREIDDWMSKNGIVHEKEVRYPVSNMRCDWELKGYGRRIFVEYFGLMNQEAYARKTDQKRRLARDNRIELVEIMPDTDWEAVLSSIRRSAPNK